MLKNWLIGIILMISSSSFASHIVGGEVYYDSLGNDQYRVTFEVYRDCSGTDFDDPLQYTVFNDDGSIFSVYSIPLPEPDTLPIVYDDPCVTPPNDICIERAIYIDTITMPATPDGYYITYQRCCWAANILNIVDPGSWGLTITTRVPGTNLVGNEDNNCARFNNYPPIVLCSNNTLDFDHSATDPDGDSLVYFMCTPKTLSIATTGVAEPNPEAPAPYADVNWETGYTGIAPLGPGSNITLDPATGAMEITPNQLGTFVAGVCVQEYRDGVLINEKMRIFGYRVVSCEVEVPLQVDLLGAGELIEDCNQAGFIVVRDDTTEAITLQCLQSGDAINGVDYNFLPDSITIPAGVETDTIFITPFADDLIEGNETLEFSVVVENPCEESYDTTTAILTIVDYVDMSITSGDSINICDQFNETGSIWCNVQNGIGPYDYHWVPTSYANNDTITFPATDLNPNYNPMYVQVTDACGKFIESEVIPVFNQCPVEMPNVITANGDDINDGFIVKNLEDFDGVHLQIFNRWGVLVYEDEDYQNNWTGKDAKGNDLTEGVYTYVVRPRSIKFEYDDQEKTRFTAHGFVHIVR